MSAKIKLKPEIIDRKCQFCGFIFTQRCHLLRHQKNQTCNSSQPTNVPNRNDDLKEIILSLKKEIVELKQNQIIGNQNIEQLKENQIIGNQQIEQLKENPPTINQINNVLQVVCVTQNDNYLDILTEQLGDFNKALEYIKNCALANINGDCQLIEKIYLCNDRPKPAFCYQDKAKTRIQYFDENKVKTCDSKQQFGQKLTNNLQNSYLKGINHVINENLDNHRCPNKFLEEYDIQTWNQHIYNLSDSGYQKKLLNQLNIPNKIKKYG